MVDQLPNDMQMKSNFGTGLEMKLLNLFKLAKYAGAGVVCFYANQAFATCESTPVLPYTFTLGSVAVSNSLPIGSDIPGSQKNLTISGSCPTSSQPGDLIIACYYGAGNEVDGYPGVYDTGVAGIGIALKNAAGQKIHGEGTHCNTTATPLGTLDSNRKYNYSVTLSLVKTANQIGTGTLFQNETRFGMGVYNKDPIGDNVNNYVAYDGDIKYRPVTCNIPPTLLIDLGNVEASKFTGVGTYSETVGKTIAISCDDTVEVKALLNGQFADADQAVLKLSSETNAAQGIGVQMLFNSLPMDTTEKGNIVGTITEVNGSLTIPLQFRYYQYAPSIQAGSGNTTATLELQYQ